MKIYRNIVIALSIVLGISFIAFLLVYSPMPRLAINESVNEEHYELLKENSLTVAKTLDKTALTDETLTADFYFNEDELVVTVDSIKAKVTAKIPISNYSANIEENNIKIQGTAELENVEYEEENRLFPVGFYFIIATVAGIAVGFMSFAIFFWIWSPFFKKI